MKNKMKFRSKETGEIRTLCDDYKDGKIHLAGENDLLGNLCYDSLKELCEKWEDAPEEKKYGGRVPKEGDEYWVVCCDGSLTRFEWDEDGVDGAKCSSAVWFEAGSAFWTEEEAEKEAARRKAYVILKEDTKGFVPDWKNYDTEKHCVFYEHEKKYLGIDYSLRYQDSLIYFATRADAEASIKAHPSEWKTWLGVEDE